MDFMKKVIGLICLMLVLVSCGKNEVVKNEELVESNIEVKVEGKAVENNKIETEKQEQIVETEKTITWSFVEEKNTLVIKHDLDNTLKTIEENNNIEIERENEVIYEKATNWNIAEKENNIWEVVKKEHNLSEVLSIIKKNIEKNYSSTTKIIETSEYMISFTSLGIRETLLEEVNSEELENIIWKKIIDLDSFFVSENKIGLNSVFIKWNLLFLWMDYYSTWNIFYLVFDNKLNFKKIDWFEKIWENIILLMWEDKKSYILNIEKDNLININLIWKLEWVKNWEINKLVKIVNNWNKIFWILWEKQIYDFDNLSILNLKEKILWSDFLVYNNQSYYISENNINDLECTIQSMIFISDQNKVVWWIKKKWYCYKRGTFSYLNIYNIVYNKDNYYKILIWKYYEKLITEYYDWNITSKNSNFNKIEYITIDNYNETSKNIYSFVVKIVYWDSEIEIYNGSMEARNSEGVWDSPELISVSVEKLN